MDTRQSALVLARGRAILGLASIALPGAGNRLALGQGATTPWMRGLWRMIGARDFVLGVGALTSVKEQTQGPEWISMGAVADAVDALVLLTVPGGSKRARVTGVLAAASAVVGLKVARDLADQRAAERGSSLEAGA
jgi:hypothetical protein